MAVMLLFNLAMEKKLDVVCMKLMSRQEANNKMQWKVADNMIWSQNEFGIHHTYTFGKRHFLFPFFLPGRMWDNHKLYISFALAYQ